MINTELTWDSYFLKICDVVAEKSHCLSIKVGCVLIKDNSIISTGYNGPPRGVTHCNKKHLEDESLIYAFTMCGLGSIPDELHECPRRILGFKSGQGLEYCPAGHAERNAITNAARIGITTKDSIIYCNRMPCKDCMVDIINAGIKEIVTLKYEFYDIQSKFIAESSKIKIRTMQNDPQISKHRRSPSSD